MAATIPAFVAELLDVWTASLHQMTAVDFDTEAQRVELYQPSPMATRMRHAIDIERAARQARPRVALEVAA